MKLEWGWMAKRKKSCDISTAIVWAGWALSSHFILLIFSYNNTHFGKYQHQTNVSTLSNINTKKKNLYFPSSAPHPFAWNTRAPLLATFNTKQFSTDRPTQQFHLFKMGKFYFCSFFFFLENLFCGSHNKTI